MMKIFALRWLLFTALCVTAMTSAAAEPRSGEQVYNQKCAMCHSSGAKGTPRIGDIAAWKPLIAKGNDALYARMISDYKGHPPRGLCKDCTDCELKASVDYLVERSR